MPRPVFLIILANPPEDDRSHHWALFIPEPHRPSSGKYITIGRSSLSGSGSYFRIYKHGYDLDAVLRTPTWDEQGEPIGTEQRRNLPRYERLYLGSIPDNMVVDLVREDQSTGEDESNDVFVVEAEKVEVPGYVSRGDSLQQASQAWIAAYIRRLIDARILQSNANSVVENVFGK